ncbi:MAG: hypothetical protein KatS3mg027_2272 [Bacteroidia bacterium]|nr:MAG: hypothetical protein KatS3mg027_2272 [Bacteroidia bacterium]
MNNNKHKIKSKQKSVDNKKRKIKIVKKLNSTKRTKKVKIYNLPKQKLFLEKVKQVLPPYLNLSGLLMEVLNISSDAAYRRIRCETEMSIDEVIRICEYLNLSLDGLLILGSEMATFKYISITNNTEKFDVYLKNILNNLDYLIPQNDVMLYYAAEEIPIFETLFNEHLVSFKMYYWMRNILSIQELQHHKFDFEIIPEHLMKIGNNIYKKYKQIPSTEIWTNETILTFIKQIEFCLETGLFKRKEDALKIIDAHFEMIDELRRMAEMSFKPNLPNIPFHLYRCDVMIGTNCIVVEKNQKPILSFISFNTLNSLSTSNEIFCREANLWVKNLIKKSTLLSGTSEKERFKFFNEMIKKSEYIRQKAIDAVYFE